MLNPSPSYEVGDLVEVTCPPYEGRTGTVLVAELYLQVENYQVDLNGWPTWFREDQLKHTADTTKVKEV